MISLRSIPRLCVALGAPETETLERLLRRTHERGHRFVEVRLDMLREPAQGVELLQRFLDATPGVVVLATCRRREARGEFDGAIEREIEILHDAVAAGAKLADVEIETAEAAPEAPRALAGAARVVLSYHDFECTPPLDEALARLRRYPADIYKIAAMGQRPTDNLRLLRLFDDEAAPPLVALAMGEAGAPTRILSPSRGAVFTFAAPDPDPGAAVGGTAPGQFTASAMRDRFQVHKRSRKTRIFGVIASPVAHSLSPVLHNRAFRRRRIDACYVPFRVEAGQLGDFLEMAAGLDVAGFSVTIPHKQAILPLLDEIDPLAARIGAVNTVQRRDGKLYGTNTDALGVVRPLEKRLELRGARVLVAGAGGAARAAVFALADRGAQVTIAGRSPDKVRALADDAGAEFLPWDDLAGREFDALVQTTPVGMHPNVAGTLFPEDIPAPVVFDMVYNPLETALLARARVQGKQTIPGLEMFLEQAIAQFELWTGARAPRTTMRDAVLEVLQGVETR